jgi:hypothetical protein
MGFRLKIVTLIGRLQEFCCLPERLWKPFQLVQNCALLDFDRPAQRTSNLGYAPYCPKTSSKLSSTSKVGRSTSNSDETLFVHCS